MILGTLRVSDVTLRRLIDIVDIIKKNPIIVTMSKFVKILVEVDKTYGSKYQVSCLFEFVLVALTAISHQSS